MTIKRLTRLVDLVTLDQYLTNGWKQVMPGTESVAINAISAGNASIFTGNIVAPAGQPLGINPNYILVWKDVDVPDRADTGITFSSPPLGLGM